MRVRFHKMHGLGNDFVVIDGREVAVALDAPLVRAIAHRHHGVGCDQLILLEPSATAAARMRIWNSDGGEVEACGNASRAVALLLGQAATVETAGGRIALDLTADGASVDMGQPRFDWADIPLAYPLDTAALPLGWDALTEPFAINVGNPHLVFFVPDIAAVPLDILGPRIETDPTFPNGINVNVAQVAGPSALAMRTWERGAGLTLACGTGACATAVAALRRKLVTGPVTVTLPGGQLLIDWAPGGSIRMTGPATHVFDGVLDTEALRP